jgi:hypothetical protein
MQAAISTRSDQRFTTVGKRVRRISNRFGGNQPPHGGYGSALVEIRRIRLETINSERIEDWEEQFGRIQRR